MTRQQQDAEDITQQTFIKAFKSLHRFDPQRPIANWLFTIARRTALNHFRSARQWVEMPEQVASGEPSPAGEVERKDEIENLWEHARRHLSRREFEVLWLRFAENLSTAETAKATGMTQTYVKVLTHRARNHLMQSHMPS
jgi:RNA polymerase sigma-70 factor (ECF subfamily)